MRSVHRPLARAAAPRRGAAAARRVPRRAAPPSAPPAPPDAAGTPAPEDLWRWDESDDALRAYGVLLAVLAAGPAAAATFGGGACLPYFLGLGECQWWRPPLATATNRGPREAARAPARHACPTTPSSLSAASTIYAGCARPGGVCARVWPAPACATDHAPPPLL